MGNVSKDWYDNLKMSCCVNDSRINKFLTKFVLPEELPGIEEPCWVFKCRLFLKAFPEPERNIILTGDPEKTFDPSIYI